MKNSKKKEFNIEDINNIIKKNPKIKEKIISNFKKKLLEIQKKNIDIRFREQAKIENFEKKSKQEINLIQLETKKKFSLKLLPIVDYVEKILNDLNSSNKENKNFTEGIVMTLNSFLKIIQNFGIHEEGKINQKFNSNLHIKVSEKKSKLIKENYITSILKKGYTLNGEKLRKSLVEVSKK
ncbi:nucleotide exchange factor GrpE [Buchnera aphidicola (Mindarus keteleerifoliae)]|uniref:nucleotide exchange factor GrpE n=1 Tax=Buchnera aphidicola TaxID=9 RepID=UPI0031B6FAE3